MVYDLTDNFTGTPSPFYNISNEEVDVVDLFLPRNVRGYTDINHELDDILFVVE